MTTTKQAVQAGNRRRTPALLAAITRPAPHNIQLNAWEWEGGRLGDPTRSAPSAGPHATLTTGAGPRHS